MTIEAKEIIVPLVTAFLASFLTHTFALRRTRAEILVKERATSFGELHQKLVAILRYCRARSVEELGSDFSETTEYLIVSENRSPLQHLHEFRAIIDKNFIYYPEKLRNKFLVFEERVLLMCSHELRCAEDLMRQSESRAITTGRS